jgi:hypothetical protein
MPVLHENRCIGRCAERHNCNLVCILYTSCQIVIKFNMEDFHVTSLSNCAFYHIGALKCKHELKCSNLVSSLFSVFFLSDLVTIQQEVPTYIYCDFL